MAISGCTALPPPGPHHAYLIGEQEFALPVQGIAARRFASVVRQQYDFSCGSAALATLLTYHYDDPHGEPDVFLGMWQGADQKLVRSLGFSLLDMKRYLATRGIEADGYTVSLAQVAAARVPGIALIDVAGYKHFVTVKAVDPVAVIVGDPALGVQRIQRREFERMWNKVYFVMNSSPRGTRPVFDSPRDLSLAPAPPLSVFAKPVDLQALALTRPLPGDL